MWRGILFVGLVMAVVTLVALDLSLTGGYLGGSAGIDEARTMAFTTLVIAQLFNCLNARSARASAFSRLFTNRWLWGAIALSLLLQVAVVELPFMNDAFSSTPLTLGDWGVCVALASIVLWAEELRKLAARRSRPAAAPAGA
jgi:magnesium-transporting ATPase (P-type)